jgi:hydroxymethylpyrimidine pyrophosphatase-like HAD family hydrolase
MSLSYVDTITLNSDASTLPNRIISELVPDLKVIYSDMDGTLLGPGGCLFKDARHGFTSAPALAVLKCHMCGIDIVPVSGRNNKQLRSDSRILGLNNWIAELGCQIVYSQGEQIVLNTGNIEPIGSSIWEHIQESGAVSLLFNEFPDQLEYHDPWAQDRECTHLLRGQIDLKLANGLLSDHGFMDLTIIDNGKVRRKTERLNPNIVDVRAYHLLPKASSKASAVKKDMAMRNIPKNNTIAIGDSSADLQLASSVGALFLVRNAIHDSPDLLEDIHCFNNVFITSYEMGLGWAEVVKYFIDRTL